MEAWRELGSCPRCESSIPGHCLLIEYETDGDRGVYAACPECDAVVNPEDG